ncbi:hypothetical protein [Kitasatospora cineracea]|uniref:hypothetical protein n=1 Tax=Kitasatospora cineracea TaxID=88074 RepID=UPI000F50E4F5|nr:hypothetical protein [Kitasatospora cineracea]
MSELSSGSRQVAVAEDRDELGDVGQEGLRDPDGGLGLLWSLAPCRVPEAVATDVEERSLDQPVKAVA